MLKRFIKYSKVGYATIKNERIIPTVMISKISEKDAKKCVMFSEKVHTFYSTCKCTYLLKTMQKK